ncbi:S8 family serine peptidase [Porticoccus sp. W117]|uniref:S8 family peptidase n=1 Tax=Porticoccus sp. W117 TaxID=3054777 RepID=UPI00259ACB73|nr:S8 family serine peptidase [Porticoccus sp. W117]MDM3870258.1 S8 family serine peptidase [Porticoccus sp. W117]
MMTAAHKVKAYAKIIAVGAVLLLAACGNAQLNSPTNLAPLSGITVPSGYTPILITLHHNANQEQAAVRSFGRNYQAPLNYSSTLLVRRQVKEIARDYKLREEKGWLINSLSIYCVLLGVPNDLVLADVMQQLRNDARVESVQHMMSYSVQSSPYNDPYFELQYENSREHIARLHREATGRGVRVMVIDTGADVSHPELKPQIKTVENFVDNNRQRFRADIHGTAIAGIIAAQPNNELGIVGLSPDADVSVLKACWQLGGSTSKAHCNSFTVASAISHAIDSKADIINMSLAGPQDPLIARLVAQALKQNILVVAADPGDAAIGYPARLPGVIGVCRHPPESGDEGRLLIHLNSANVLTTAPDGGFDFFSGSSMSAAKVSAMAALMREKQPDLDPGQVVTNLQHMVPAEINTNNRSKKKLP